MTSTLSVKNSDDDSDVVYSLKERVRELEKLLGQEWAPPLVLRLTRMERRVLGAITAKPTFCTHETLYDIVYGDRANPVTGDAPRVFVHLVRRKLQPFGIEIRNRHGEGYFITPENLERLNALYAEGERA